MRAWEGFHTHSTISHEDQWEVTSDDFSTETWGGEKEEQAAVEKAVVSSLGLSLRWLTGLGVAGALCSYPAVSY